MRARALTVFVFLAAFVAACSPPKFVRYKSVSGDFSVFVPWGWNIIADADYDVFSQVQFIGPHDPDFFLGAPSMSVSWHKNNRPHRLRDNSVELYTDAKDYIHQMVSDVYGKKSILYGVGVREDGGREIITEPQVITLKESQLPAIFFGILSPTPAPEASQWGVNRDDQGKLVNVRLHDFAVVSVGDGFYVFCYPATQRGYSKNADRFRTLINTFHPYQAGPGGPKITLRRSSN
jgi:hypothetical protein